MMVCVNPKHYDVQDGAIAVKNALTLDPRLHVADGTPCVDHRPTTIPLHSDPRYLREFCAWAEGQYPQGAPGHAAVQAVLKGLRSAVYQARRDGRCLLCGGTR